MTDALAIELSPTRRFEMESSIEARLLSTSLSYVDAVELAMSTIDPTTPSGLDALLKIQRVNCSTLQALRSNRAPSPPRPQPKNSDEAKHEAKRLLNQIAAEVQRIDDAHAANMRTSERVANEFTNKR